MSQRERKRIPYHGLKLLPLKDETAFTKNKCSERARKIKSITPNLVFDVWFDQHYQIRQQFGDDNGLREGIDSEKVESLVLRSMKYLIAYSSILKSFNFINHTLDGGSRANRVILQESTAGELLNVVIEAHLIEIDKYEITVKTAMCSNSFKLSDGQFAMEVIDNESILKRMERGQVREVYTL